MMSTRQRVKTVGVITAQVSRHLRIDSLDNISERYYTEFDSWRDPKQEHSIASKYTVRAETWHRVRNLEYRFRLERVISPPRPPPRWASPRCTFTSAASLSAPPTVSECERANVLCGVVLFQTGASATRPSGTPRTGTGTTTPTRPPRAAGRGTFASTRTSTAAAAPGGRHKPLPPPPPPLPAVLEWDKSPIRPHSCRPQVTTTATATGSVSVALRQRKSLSQLEAIDRCPLPGTVPPLSPRVFRSRGAAACHAAAPARH